MMDREYSKFALICDVCGEEAGPFESVEEVIDYKREERWKTQRGQDLDLGDGWVDVCPVCQKLK